MRSCQKVYIGILPAASMRLKMFDALDLESRHDPMTFIDQKKTRSATRMSNRSLKEYSDRDGEMINGILLRLGTVR